MTTAGVKLDLPPGAWTAALAVAQEEGKRLREHLEESRRPCPPPATPPAAEPAEPSSGPGRSTAEGAGGCCETMAAWCEIYNDDRKDFMHQEWWILDEIPPPTHCPWCGAKL